jgi:hypothetical protein
MAEAREPPKKGVTLVIWPILVLYKPICWYGRVIATLRSIMEPFMWVRVLYNMPSRAGGGRIPAGAVRKDRQSVHVPMAGQKKGSRRATARREERGAEGRARIITQ